MKEWIQDIQDEVLYAEKLFFEIYPEVKDYNMLQDENCDYFILFGKMNENPVGAIFDRGNFTLTLLESVIY